MFEEGKKYKLSIIRQESSGAGIAKANKFPVFIPYSLPTELVEVKITKVKKSYAEGEVVKNITTSKDRIEVECPYYYKCGGCDLMHQKYNATLDFKMKNLKELLYKFSKIDSNYIKLNKIVEAEDKYFYRNKVTFHVDNDKLGFYLENTNDLIEIDECIIINPIFNVALKIIKKYIKDSGINKVIMRYGIHTKELMIVFDTYKVIDNKLIDELNKKIKVLKSVYMFNKNKFTLLSGESHIKEKLLDKTFMISPKSFFQVNTLMAEMMFSKVLKYITNTDINILDLYCGIGVISIIINKPNKKIIGVDIVKDAIKDANENKVLNNSENIEFVAANVKKVLQVIKKAKKSLDVIILDPPRSGVDKDSIKVINELLPKKIIYISCNPTTLCRDLKILKEKYDVKEITPFDLFSQTHHIEAVTLLTLKK